MYDRIQLRGKFTALVRPNDCFSQVERASHDIVIAIHLAATVFMTGLIWFVQVVHYPLFAAVGREQFANYEQLHTTLTTYVVGPVMLLELGTALLVAYSRPGVTSYLGLGLLAVIWASTAFLQVPKHNVLQYGFDAQAHAALVSTNWIRTVCWTARTVLCVAVFGVRG